MSQYIGKTISLISSKGIRYVGILQDVNGDEATVTLKNVKPFGTEGRLGDPQKEIPSSNDIYPVVVFRGSDVHDLSVLEDPTPTPTPTLTTSQQPTQVEAQKPAPQSAPESAPLQQQTTQESYVRRERDQTKQPQESETESEQRQQYGQRQNRPRQNRQKEVPSAFNSAVPSNDFDFNSVSELKRDAATEDQDEDGIKTEEIAPAYDKKKSFFDTISSSATTQSNRPPREFNNYSNNQQGGRGRGRGRGRGGRGRGGRGYYDNESTPAWA